jgi:helicase
MTDELKAFRGEAAEQLVRKFDNESFQASLDPSRAPVSEGLVELKLSAMLAYEEWLEPLALFGESSLASFKFEGEPAATSQAAFDKWHAYLTAPSISRAISVRDLLLTAASGLAAQRQTDLRYLLGREEIAARLTDPLDDHAQWPRRVQDTVSRALLLIVRQAFRSDLDLAQRYVTNLEKLQAEAESAWLREATHPAQTALSLLALYHCAQATSVLSRYVAEGELPPGTGHSANVRNELRVLLGKAEEYANLSSDPELVTWTRSVIIVSLAAVADSIWDNGRNITATIDKLLKSMSMRDQAIYSMLPSQRDALNKNFLDPQREAVVLQMPTSSGKTLLAEIAALQTLASYADARVVYLTPTRALSTQVRRTLGADFAALGIDVTAAGSAFEEDPFEQALLAAVRGVVVFTPEKLDLVLRGRAAWFSAVRLVIVDEAHLLRDGERGARLEILLANLRREHPHIRLLLLTPFVENAQELATWLSDRRGSDVDVKWRPSRLIVGLATLAGQGKTRRFEIEWREPHRPSSLSSSQLPLSSDDRKALQDSNSVRTKTILIAKKLRVLGPSLAIFPASRVAAEEAALAISALKDPLDASAAPPEFRVAVALAEAEYGTGSTLAQCLKHGVAYHHSALSSELRYLVERLASLKTIDFIAATTTLAQGMNFPVASVVIHSVHKPRAGNLSPAEFWNIAGRAGRVGLAEKGVIVFADKNHRTHWEHYTAHLSERIESALAAAIAKIEDTDTVKWTYQRHEGIRPFIQYLGHAIATLGARETIADLDRLVDACLAGRDMAARSTLTHLARRYLSEVSGKAAGYMKVADQTGLASFSFDQLYAAIHNSPVLMYGNAEDLQAKDGLLHLVNALANLPELSLAIESGHGTIDTALVAGIVHGWINGSSIEELSEPFEGSAADKVRDAARYVFGKVSQTVSWGAHAYLRGRDLLPSKESATDMNHRMLPAYIQYGVSSPEAVMASILGVPRSAATAIGKVYVNANGPLQSDQSVKFRTFLNGSTPDQWAQAVAGSRLAGKVSPIDLYQVWRRSQGAS